ncbi:hypothetical protein BT96DRAFT_620697 [Gymnopus androsaceus JB14]|uniref:Uncharacterized protein n=1 Tax=Gymnopus androsaceus JB14 TaxID=1447944 RepID=A0A6A4HWK9_9AGAR|nr:hypothetical protein BT96DRAFT_620697 [Gymnopus androsaceus JB14]
MTKCKKLLDGLNGPWIVVVFSGMKIKTYHEQVKRIRTDLETGIAAIKIPWQRQAEITGTQVPYACDNIAEPLVGDVGNDAGDASMSRGTSFRAKASNPDSWTINNANTTVHDSASYSQSERQAETSDLSSPSTFTGIPTFRSRTVSNPSSGRTNNGGIAAASYGQTERQEGRASYSSPLTRAVTPAQEMGGQKASSTPASLSRLNRMANDQGEKTIPAQTMSQGISSTPFPDSLVETAITSVDVSLGGGERTLSSPSAGTRTSAHPMSQEAPSASLSHTRVGALSLNTVGNDVNNTTVYDNSWHTGNGNTTVLNIGDGGVVYFYVSGDSYTSIIIVF